MARSPPSCSKHNPVERQVFPHITRACRGVNFHTVEMARQFIARARTDAGLRVTVSRLDEVYATGRTDVEGFRASVTVAFDYDLPNWNYRPLPQTA